MRTVPDRNRADTFEGLHRVQQSADMIATGVINVDDRATERDVIPAAAASATRVPMPTDGVGRIDGVDRMNGVGGTDGVGEIDGVGVAAVARSLARRKSVKRVETKPCWVQDPLGYYYSKEKRFTTHTTWSVCITF